MEIENYTPKVLVKGQRSYVEMLVHIAKKYNRPIKEFNRRLDGRIEWICSHGIGHTVWYPKGSEGLHGCDGCCKQLHEGEKERNTGNPGKN